MRSPVLRNPAWPRAQPGLTLIELVVVICIVGVLGAVALERLRFYQEAAEKASMEGNVGVLKSALQLRVAALLVKGEGGKIESLARENPFDWLQERPLGYQGEFRAPQPSVPRGSWYFDAANGQMVYVPNLDDHLERLGDGSKRIRFRVRLELGKAGTGPERKQITAIRIEPVVPYVWF